MNFPRVGVPETKLRTIVADDIPASLHMMVSTLEERCEIVATACDGLEALDAIRRFKPELAVLDLTMPRLNGLGALRAHQALYLSYDPTLRCLLAQRDRDNCDDDDQERREGKNGVIGYGRGQPGCLVFVPVRKGILE